MDDNHKKFDRIIAILIQLQSKRIVKAQELADRFRVSLRTIYRDIKTLENSGVPIVSEAGVGYSIMEGYKLPPVMFTREEATGFVAAEKLMERYVDKSLGKHFQSAMFKIKSVLRWAEKDLLDSLDENVQVRSGVALFDESVPNALEVLMNGIVHKKQVRVHYHAFESERTSERNLEPIGLYHDHNYWYLMAYCHLRNDYRKFRTDRIKGIRLLDTSFEEQHESLDFYLKRAQAGTEEYIDITLLVDKPVTRYMVNSKKYYGFIGEQERGNQVEMQFRQKAGELDYFARWYLMYGDAIEIKSPALLKTHIKNLIEKITYRLA